MTVSIDFENRRISIDRSMTARELYSDLQDAFDEPSAMDSPVPMEAVTPARFNLVNGWQLYPEAVAMLEEGAVINDCYGNKIEPPPPIPPRPYTPRKVFIRRS